MKFNYRVKQLAFIEEWKRLEKEYKEAGMSEDAIREMKAFDWEMFKKERIYCMHNQLMTVNYYPDGNKSDLSRPGLMDKFFEEFSYEDKHFINDRYGWIECLDDEELIQNAKSLSLERKELLTKYVFDGKTHKEIAEEMKTKKTLVTKKLTTIKKLLKKF